MKHLKKYIDGTGNDEENEYTITTLIEAKFDRDKKREWTKKLVEEHGVKRTPSHFGRLFKKRSFLFSIAAGFLLLITAFLSWPTLLRTSLQASVDQHIATLSIMGDQTMLRKGSADIDAIRNAATQHYVKKEYKKSLVELQRLESADKANASDYFYMGICHLKKMPADAPAAIAALQKTDGLKIYNAEISWILALAYLKAGQMENGKAALQSIVEKRGYKWKEAEGLMNEGLIE